MSYLFTAVRGTSFTESFDFKNDKGKPVAAPAGDFRVVLERGALVREYGVKRLRTGVVWTMTSEETNELEYSTMYFALYFNGQEIARGVLRVQ